MVGEVDVEVSLVALALLPAKLLIESEVIVAGVPTAVIEFVWTTGEVMDDVVTRLLVEVL